jgi:hypothetical protein
MAPSHDFSPFLIACRSGFPCFAGSASHNLPLLDDTPLPLSIR